MAPRFGVRMQEGEADGLRMAVEHRLPRCQPHK